MPHANAPLTELGRLRLARCVVDEGWPLRRAAERFQVSATTATRWAARYRQLGAAGMADRSSRPHQCPARTHRRLERKVAHLRTKQLGPAAIAGRLGMHASTVHRVLVRLGCPKLSAVDLATGQPIRRPPVIRYEHAAPGDLVHVDIKKLGTIPDGGGHRAHGRSQAKQNNDLPAVRRRASHSYVHTAIDDNSRLAYSEILPDETGPTAAAFWTRAHAWFAAAGITVVRVLKTTAAATNPAPGNKRWLSPTADTSEPGPTGPKPTARSNASTEPCNGNGHTSGSTPATRPAPEPCRAGYTSTTITDHTPHSGAAHQRAASPTCRGSTTRPPKPAAWNAGRISK